MPLTEKHLYSQLRQAGYGKKYVQDVLFPRWWDGIAQPSEAAVQEVAMVVASRLQVTYSSLVGAGDLEALVPMRVRHKKRRDAEDGDVRVATQVACAAARAAARGATRPVEVPTAPDAIRNRILARGARWVGLPELVGECWRMGVVVLHVGEAAVPKPNQAVKRVKRPDGLATMVGDRPVVVLMSGKTHPAWMLFHLAHELGHVALQHVAPGDTIVDVSFDASDAGSDADERSADEFASVLLNGSALAVGGPRLAGSRLARWAISYGTEHRIDPGHLALNYANVTKNYAIGANALRFITGCPAGQDVLREALQEHLEWDELGESAEEFLTEVAAVCAPD